MNQWKCIQTKFNKKWTQLGFVVCGNALCFSLSHTDKPFLSDTFLRFYHSRPHTRTQILLMAQICQFSSENRGAGLTIKAHHINNLHMATNTNTLNVHHGNMIIQPNRVQLPHRDPSSPWHPKHIHYIYSLHRSNSDMCVLHTWICLFCVCQCLTVRLSSEGP